MTTRFPNGVSLTRPYIGGNSASLMFTAGDQTPDVSLGGFFVAAPTSIVTLTNFDAGARDVQTLDGKVIYVLAISAGMNVIQSSAGGIITSRLVITTTGGSPFVSVATAGNLTLQNNELVSFIRYGNSWYQLDKSVQTVAA